MLTLRGFTLGLLRHARSSRTGPALGGGGGRVRRLPLRVLLGVGLQEPAFLRQEVALTPFEAPQDVLLWQQDVCLCRRIRRQRAVGSQASPELCGQGSGCAASPFSGFLGARERLLRLLEDFYCEGLENCVFCLEIIF